MSWPILACISIITVSVAGILERVLMKNEQSNPIGYAILFQLILGSISLVFAVVFGKFALPSVSIPWYQFIISSVLWAASTVFTFQAVKTLTAGEVTILSASGAIISILLGIIFLREVLTVPLLIGTVLILLAIWIINTEHVSFSSKRGIIFALLAALCAGIAVVNDASILKHYEAFSYTAIMSFLPGILLICCFPKELVKTVRTIHRNVIFMMVIFCLFYAIQAITYYLAFQYGAPVSQLSPLTKSSIVLTVILAAVFLKEKSNLPKKIIAAILVTVGAILLG